MHSYIRRVGGICRVEEICPQSRDLSLPETPKNRSSRDIKWRYSAPLVGGFDVFLCPVQPLDRSQSQCIARQGS
jgi:hypothetical protein